MRAQPYLENIMSKTLKYIGLPIALLGIAALASTAQAEKKTFISIGANPVGLTN